MIRATFLAAGVFLILCGAALAAIDRVVLTDYADRQLRRRFERPAAGDRPALRLIYPEDAAAGVNGPYVIDPPDWGGFCLLSIGGVTVLYSLCLPGRPSAEPDDDAD